MRFNVLMLIFVLASAAYLVNVQYESRRLFAEINKAEQEGRRLEAQFEGLQVEKRAQATPGRIEKLAREKLQMRGNNPAITHYVSAEGPWVSDQAINPPKVEPGASSGSRTQAQGRVQ